MIREITVKSVLNKKKQRDSWFLDDYTLNPYEGCSFNCQYCYVRGSKYGENMAETLAVKINACEVLDRQLAFRVKKDQRGIIALASATDPYIRIEEKLRMTEGFLKLILKHRFPVLMITKSDMIVRDLALLKEIDTAAIHAADLRDTFHRGTIVSFSFSTLDESIAATLEPGAPSPQKRLEAMQRCREAGLMTGVNCIPTLPFLSDSDEELEHMIVSAKAHGAEYILIGGLTLFGDGPADSKTLYYKFLQRYSPAHIADYKRLYRIFHAPSPDYLHNLQTRAAQLCLKHGIRNQLV